MKRGRGTAVAIALFGAALAAAGCGLGPGEGVGEVSLTVTRDYGSEPVLSVRDEASESDTVMRVLERNADISTRFGGGFVASIDGLAEAVRDGRRHDWFFYVNGIESPVGAAEFALRGGEAIWWDYRDWSAASRVPAVVGSWPQPFRDGYEGRWQQTSVVCLGGGPACAVVGRGLEQAGAQLVSGESADGAIQVLVGPWERVKEETTAAQLEKGPEESGVFADFESRPDGYRLLGLDEEGEEVRAFGAGAGLVAATRRFDAPPVWIVTGTDSAGVGAAARLLGDEALRDRYAVVTDAGETFSLPLR